MKLDSFYIRGHKLEFENTGGVSGDELEIRITTKSEASQELRNKLISYLIDEGFLPFKKDETKTCLLYTSPSPRDLSTSRMPSSA